MTDTSVQGVRSHPPLDPTSLPPSNPTDTLVSRIANDGIALVVIALAAGTTGVAFSYGFLYGLTATVVLFVLSVYVENSDEMLCNMNNLEGEDALIKIQAIASKTTLISAVCTMVAVNLGIAIFFYGSGYLLLGKSGFSLALKVVLAAGSLLHFYCYKRNQLRIKSKLKITVESLRVKFSPALTFLILKKLIAPYRRSSSIESLMDDFSQNIPPGVSYQDFCGCLFPLLNPQEAYTLFSSEELQNKFSENKQTLYVWLWQLPHMPQENLKACFAPTHLLKELFNQIARLKNNNSTPEALEKQAKLSEQLKKWQKHLIELEHVKDPKVRDEIGKFYQEGRIFKTFKEAAERLEKSIWGKLKNLGHPQSSPSQI